MLKLYKCIMFARSFVCVFCLFVSLFDRSVCLFICLCAHVWFCNGFAVCMFVCFV